MRKRFLYRICTSTSKLVMAALAVFLVAGAVLHLAAQGQQRQKRPNASTQQNQKYPEIPGKTIQKARALAVMVWTGDEKAINNPRLVPLFVYYENQFNDANTYFAQPYPLALEGGTVYEVESHGERQGYFTVDRLQRYRGDWFGMGQWKTMAEVTPVHRSHKKDTHDADDDRPILKRHAGSGSGNDGSGAKEQIKAEDDNPELAQEMSDDPDRPTLKHQPNTGSGNTGSGSGSASTGSGNTGSASTGSGNDDANVSALPTPEDNAKNLAQELSADKSRPNLKHNAGTLPSGSSSADMQMTQITRPSGSQQSGDEPTGPQIHIRVAVSDASPQDIHSYHFQLSVDDEAKYRKLLTGMAFKALASAPGVTSAATPTPTPAAHKTTHAATKKKPAPTVVQPELQDVHMDAFDLAYTNNPVIVFSAAARYPNSALIRYVTVVMRTETTGETEEIFQSVTGNDRLDVTPRLLLVDAVDAYGSGRGDLLFREISDTGTTFVFYRVEHSNLVKIFEGGDLPLLAAN